MTTDNQNVYAIDQASLCQGVDKALAATYKVAALINDAVAGKTLYSYINSSKQIEFNYKPTVLSPKKFFFPQEETLFEYSSDGKVTAKTANASPQVLFGIRPCDLNAINLMDEAFAEGHGDPNYLARREQTVVIGIDCHAICDKDAFCYKVKAQNVTTGFDIMLHPIDAATNGKFLMKVATAKGQAFADKYFPSATATTVDAKLLQDFVAKKDQAFGAEKPFEKLEQFPELFTKHAHHPIWKQEGDRCLSCGSCIMVCPTCYCFDVGDETELNLKKGARTRKWDACMLSSFAVVAGGENFRHAATARLHHRINRKFNFLMAKHGRSVCVGCGRCVRACLADISPKTIAEAIINSETTEA